MAFLQKAQNEGRGTLNVLDTSQRTSVSGAMRVCSHEKVCAELGWVPFFIKQEKEGVFPSLPIKYDVFAIHRLCLFYKVLKGSTDLHSLIPSSTQITIMTLRSHNTQQVTT
ncbi:unnamed protein product [Didymodactylos carnosus]|uniref:Uncharacterized protein n=1 Tax=Didymodactylos carnosus TaxID=1234261 RepID=A0A8S2YAS9_9BILA|nr:unnamed protein product [Didymodactylos carnosus]